MAAPFILFCSAVVCSSSQLFFFFLPPKTSLSTSGAQAGGSATTSRPRASFSLFVTPCFLSPPSLCVVCQAEATPYMCKSQTLFDQVPHVRLPFFGTIFVVPSVFTTDITTASVGALPWRSVESTFFFSQLLAIPSSGAFAVRFSFRVRLAAPFLSLFPQLTTAIEGPQRHGQLELRLGRAPPVAASQTFFFSRPSRWPSHSEHTGRPSPPKDPKIFVLILLENVRLELC